MAIDNRSSGQSSAMDRDHRTGRLPIARQDVFLLPHPVIWVKWVKWNEIQQGRFPCSGRYVEQCRTAGGNPMELARSRTRCALTSLSRGLLLRPRSLRPVARMPNGWSLRLTETREKLFWLGRPTSVRPSRRLSPVVSALPSPSGPTGHRSGKPTGRQYGDEL